ncbi:fibronectin type III domain-containing protein [Candidatus Berkelbacteria bacterium]|nr:fibronectin type III domain-containing protein [Candidatus Berkelbacteria bacterium]
MAKINKLFRILLALLIGMATFMPSQQVLANPAAPAEPSALTQLTNDGKTQLQVGDTIVQHELIIRATLSDPDPADTLTFEVEVRELAVAFTGTPTHQAVGQPTVANSPITVSLAINVPADGSYHWQARSRDGSGGLSAWRSFPFPSSNTEATADFSVDTTPPKAPTNVTAKADFARAIVNWSNATDVNRVEIYRSNTAGSLGELVGTVTGTSFTSTGLDEGKSYYFSLIALDTVGHRSVQSEQALAVTELRPDDGATSGYAQSGTWNTVSSAAGQESDYRWATGDSGATATFRPNVSVTGDYEVYVSWVVDPTGVPGPQAKDAPYKIITPSRDASFAIDQSLKANGTYEENAWSGWKMLGTFSLESGTSSSITLTAQGNGFVVADASRFVYLRPAAPKNLTISDRANDRGNALILSWDASASQTALKYRIYRTQMAGQYDRNTKLAELTTTSYTDETVVPGATYYYIVTATDGTNESAPSLEVSAASVTQIFPAAPANLAMIVSDNQATLSWSKVEGANSYVVRFRKTSDASFSTVVISGTDVTTTTLSGLNPESDYEFGVASRDSSGNNSAFTSESKKTLSSKVAVEVAKGKTVEEAEAAVKSQKTQPTAPATGPKQEKEEAQVKPEESKQEAAPAKQRIPRRLAVAIVIILVAIGAGLVGYYGLDWLSKEKPGAPGPKPPTKRNGRW